MQERTLRFDYSSLESVVVGQPAAEFVAAAAERFGSRRVFVLASNSLSAGTDCILKITAALGDRFAAQGSPVAAHTPRPDVLRAIAEARDAQADLLVSVGGGSVVDAAKVVQLALSQDIRSESALLAYARFTDGSGGKRAGRYEHYKPSTVRQIAVPTTLSGAEHSNNAGVTDPVQAVKEGYRAPDLYPRMVVYDPSLAVYTPRWLWLSTAIRSLDHAVEGFCSADCHPFLEAHFLHAVSLLFHSLPDTVQAPGNTEALALNQQAVWLACCGLGKVSHGASHGIGYILGARCQVPHGYTSCVMLPAVLEYNAGVNGDRQARLRQASGVDMPLADAVRTLVRELGLPSTLQEVGIDRTQLPEIAELACAHRVVQRNPRRIRDARDVMDILERAWG
ncbi:MAG: iron-containing alcohol dehydrogenase [Pseudohongiellaceae bacterium]